MAEELARLIAETLAADETGTCPYVDADYLEEAVIDGRFNLVKLAEVLAANGYGKLEDAWSEGRRYALRNLANGGGSEQCNPYRRPE